MSATAVSLPAIPGDFSLRKLTLLIAGILLASFIAQWPGPRMADWQLFAFYDPGTILHGDLLLEKGYVPTVDFGYTAWLGPAALMAALGFAIFGRTPWTFLGLTLLTELVMAWALARILIATGIAQSWRRGNGLCVDRAADGDHAGVSDADASAGGDDDPAGAGGAGGGG